MTRESFNTAPEPTLQANISKTQATTRQITLTSLMMMLMLTLALTAQAAVYTVTNTNDSGAGSLRAALAAANATAADDVIDLTGVSGTITLTSGELTIANNGTLTIEGPSADQLTISGNDLSRVFYIGTGSDATINRVTISDGNGTGALYSGSGGGIYIYSRGWDPFGNVYSFTKVTINDSTFSGNSAQFSGGGIHNNGDLVVNNSTFSGNSAASFGGGIFNNNQLATMVVLNSTFSGNSADSGGGTFNTGALDGHDIFVILNSIIANSTNGDDCLSYGPSAVAYSLIADGSCGAYAGTNGNLTGDPMLGPLQDNGGPTKTHALLPGSPAIDAGHNDYIPRDHNHDPVAFDQRGAGFPRIFNTTIDMGSFEFSPLDEDGDGVLDADDVCPGTVIPELDLFDLRKNRFAVNADGEFVDATGAFSGYTIADTGGCSATQIIDEMGLGGGHASFGISRSALETWIAMLPPE